jgi:hypothetical protein
MTRPQVFLFQAPLSALEPHIGVAQLFAMLKLYGYDVRVFDVNMALYRRLGGHLLSEETDAVWTMPEPVEDVLGKHRDWISSEFIAPVARAERPVVGFTTAVSSILSSRLLAGWIKAANPGALVVFGGQSFTTHSETVRRALEGDAVDVVVRGDGEASFVELAQLHEEGRALEECKGVFLRGPDGQPRFTGRRPPQRLDLLPFADFSAYDRSLYGNHRVGGHDILLMASRGCVRNCAFCGQVLGWPGFRQMSAERIYAEIKYQRRATPPVPGQPPQQIKFYDLLINGDLRNLSRLAELLISDREPPLEWKEANCNVDPNMTEDFCRRLYAAGCRTLIVGLESGSQRVLDLMRKEQTLDQMKTFLRNVHRAGLKTRANFMFGFPGETEEDFRATLDFIDEMGDYIHFIYPSYTLTHLNGALEKGPEQFGVPSGQNTYYWDSADGANTFPVRLDRFRRFREFAAGLGLRVIDGLQMPLPAFVEFSLAGYHDHKRNAPESLKHYREFLKHDPANAYALARVEALQKV